MSFSHGPLAKQRDVDKEPYFSRRGRGPLKVEEVLTEARLAPGSIQLYRGFM
jgi:hypothetical protein